MAAPLSHPVRPPTGLADRPFIDQIDTRYPPGRARHEAKDRILAMLRGLSASRPPDHPCMGREARC